MTTQLTSGSLPAVGTHTLEWAHIHIIAMHDVRVRLLPRARVQSGQTSGAGAPAGNRGRRRRQGGSSPGVQENRKRYHSSCPHPHPGNVLSVAKRASKKVLFFVVSRGSVSRVITARVHPIHHTPHVAQRRSLEEERGAQRRPGALSRNGNPKQGRKITVSAAPWALPAPQLDTSMNQLAVAQQSCL
jgi:hypothetical protein